MSARRERIPTGYQIKTERRVVFIYDTIQTMKKPTIASITKTSQRQILSELTRASLEILKRHGVQDIIPWVSGNTKSFNLTISCTANNAQKVIDQALASRTDADKTIELFFLSENCLPTDIVGKAVRFAGKTFVIVGIQPHAKAPFISVSTADGSVRVLSKSRLQPKGIFFLSLEESLHADRAWQKKRLETALLGSS